MRLLACLFVCVCAAASAYWKPRRHFLEGGEERRVLTSEVFAKKHARDMEVPARGATAVADEKLWRGDQEKFPIRTRLA